MPDFPEILIGLANNPPLLEATKKALLDEFRAVADEGGRSDMELGQMYRARIVGVQTVEKVFKRIEKLKTVAPSEPRVASHR